MPQVRYIGPHDRVEIPSFGLTVERDFPVEVSDAQADALCEQATWELLDPSKKTVTSTVVSPAAPVLEG